MRVGRRSDLPQPEPVSSSSLSSFLPWLRRGLRQGSHDEGQRGRLLPSMEAMSATWAHTWLRFKVNPRPSFLFDLIRSPPLISFPTKLQLDRCRDATMEQSGPPFSSRFVRSSTASHFRRPCTTAAVRPRPFLPPCSVLVSLPLPIANKLVCFAPRRSYHILSME